MRRLLLTGLLAVALALALTACGGDDGGDEDGAASTTTTSPADPSTTTTPATTDVPPVDSTFEADDVAALCEELEGLAEIDPDADPTQDQVDRIRSIAEDAPTGVAEPLEAVAAFGQAIVDDDSHQDTATIQTEAAEAATVLIAYGNEACGIDVPLFNTIAGV